MKGRLPKRMHLRKSRSIRAILPRHNRIAAVFGPVEPIEAVRVCELDSAPVFDGMIAADEKLFISMADGSVVCLGERK